MATLRLPSVVLSITVNELPEPVAELCAILGGIEGVEAVTIGGSRAAGTADESSDWDVGVYYRGGIDLARLARYGEVLRSLEQLLKEMRGVHRRRWYPTRSRVSLPVSCVRGTDHPQFLSMPPEGPRAPKGSRRSHCRPSSRYFPGGR